MASEEIYEYVKAIAISSFDLGMSYFAGALINKPFGKTITISNLDEFWKVLLLVMAQTGISATVLIGLRRLMYPLDMDDSTGGAFFMMGLLMPQQNLWNNLNGLWNFMFGKLARISGTDLQKPSPNMNISGSH